MKRASLFLISLILPALFGWWMFIPVAILYVFLAKLPYEIAVAAAFLDSFYYFGDGFWWRHALTSFSLALLALAFVLSRTIHWRKLV